jgi:hypothetical protein
MSARGAVPKLFEDAEHALDFGTKRWCSSQNRQRLVLPQIFRRYQHCRRTADTLNT